jgi:ketosteroid isomerase-like protein
MSSSREVVNEAYAAFGRGDIESLLELLSEEIDWHVPEVLPQGGSFRGRDGVGEFFAGIPREWPEFEIEMDDLITEGDLVVGIGHAKGTLASGEAADYGFAHVFTVGDGKIVRFREYAAPGPGLLATR